MNKCGLDDEACGKHSGIPPCCRRWFIEVWIPTREKAAKDPELWIALGTAYWNRSKRPDFRNNFFRGPHYILCPGCKHCHAYNYLLECPRESGGMADTADSKSAALNKREGSTPSSPTTP